MNDGSSPRAGNDRGSSVQHRHTAVFRALHDASADLTTDRIRAAVASGAARCWMASMVPTISSRPRRSGTTASIPRRSMALASAPLAIVRCVPRIRALSTPRRTHSSATTSKILTTGKSIQSLWLQGDNEAYCWQGERSSRRHFAIAAERHGDTRRNATKTAHFRFRRDMIAPFVSREIQSPFPASESLP